MSRLSTWSARQHSATEAIERPNLIVVGVDGSPQSLAAARSRTRALRRLRPSCSAPGPPPMTPIAVGAAVAGASRGQRRPGRGVGRGRGRQCRPAVGEAATAYDRVVEVATPAFLLQRDGGEDAPKRDSMTSPEEAAIVAWIAALASRAKMNGSRAGETPHANNQINQICHPAGVMIVSDEFWRVHPPTRRVPSR